MPVRVRYGDKCGEYARAGNAMGGNFFPAASAAVQVSSAYSESGKLDPLSVLQPTNRSA